MQSPRRATFPTAQPFDPEVSVERARSTAERPAALEITLSNVTDRHVTVRAGEEHVYSTERSDGDALYLVDPGADVERSGGPGCWRLGDPTPMTEPDILVGTDLAPRETVSKRQAVWTMPDVDACLPTGVHSFAEEFAVLDGERYEWSFGIEVTDEA